MTGHLSSDKEEKSVRRLKLRKGQHYNQAERLYVVELYNLNEIAKILKLDCSTVKRWKRLGDWGIKRARHIENKGIFHEELFEFVKKLMRLIMADIESGGKADAGTLNFLRSILPQITRIKEYEELKNEGTKESKPKGLTEDTIRTIEREILGLER
jgi:hypothetical protein